MLIKKDAPASTYEKRQFFVQTRRKFKALPVLNEAACCIHSHPNHNISSTFEVYCTCERSMRIFNPLCKKTRCTCQKSINMLISSKHYLLPVHCTLCICRKVNLVFRGVHVSDISTLDSHHRYRTVVIFFTDAATEWRSYCFQKKWTLFKNSQLYPRWRKNFLRPPKGVSSRMF